MLNLRRHTKITVHLHNARYYLRYCYPIHQDRLQKQIKKKLTVCIWAMREMCCPRGWPAGGWVGEGAGPDTYISFLRLLVTVTSPCGCPDMLPGRLPVLVDYPLTPTWLASTSDLHVYSLFHVTEENQEWVSVVLRSKAGQIACIPKSVNLI